MRAKILKISMRPNKKTFRRLLVKNLIIQITLLNRLVLHIVHWSMKSLMMDLESLYMKKAESKNPYAKEHVPGFVSNWRGTESSLDHEVDEQLEVPKEIAKLREEELAALKELKRMEKHKQFGKKKIFNPSFEILMTKRR